MSAPTERPHLADLRRARGWTQAEVAERLAHLAWSRHRTQVGVNANMIAKWERGTKGVSLRYRRLLAELFHVHLYELGLGDPQPPNGDQATQETLIGFIDSAVNLMGSSSAANLLGQLLRSEPHEVNRRRVAIMLDRIETSDEPSLQADIPTPDALVATHQGLYDSCDARSLMTAIAAHIRTIDTLLIESSPPARSRLLRNRGRAHLTAGRLAAEKLDEELVAAGHFVRAADDAVEAGDEVTASMAAGYTALLAIRRGESTAAIRRISSISVSDAATVNWLRSIERAAADAAGLREAVNMSSVTPPARN